MTTLAICWLKVVLIDINSDPSQRDSAKIHATLFPSRSFQLIIHKLLLNAKLCCEVTSLRQVKHKYENITITVKLSAWPCSTAYWHSPITPHHYVHKIARQTERYRIHWCHLYSYFPHISRTIKLGVTLRPIWNIRRMGAIKTTLYGSRGNKLVKYPLLLVLRYTGYTFSPPQEIQ